MEPQSGVEHFQMSAELWDCPTIAATVGERRHKQIEKKKKKNINGL